MINLDFIKQWWKELLIGVLFLLLICIGLYIYEGKHQEELEKAKILTAEQVTNVNALQNILEISKKNAEELAKQTAMAQVGQIAPVNHFTVTAPSLPAAVQSVQERINRQDPTLPPQALAKSDRTIVAPQPDNKDYQVGIYKIDLQKNWEWATGIGVHNGDVYIPVELQRNYSKDKALSAEVHVSTTGKVSGGEVKYKVMTDKLFGLF